MSIIMTHSGGHAVLKKTVFLLLAVSAIPLSLPAQSDTGEAPNSTARESGNTHSQLSTEEREISIVGWKFARAVLSGDTDTMRSLAVPDANFCSERDYFDNGLESMVLIGIYPSMKGRSVDPGADFDTVSAYYEISKVGLGYFFYLEIYMEQTENGWKVRWYLFDA